MPRRVKNSLKGTNEFLVTLAPQGKPLQAMFIYSVWYALDPQHLECVMSASLCTLVL